MVAFLDDKNLVTSSRKIVGADAGAAARAYDHDISLQDPGFGIVRWGLEIEGEALPTGTMSRNFWEVDHFWEGR